MGLPFTVTAECAMEHAKLAVGELGHEYVGTEHLLLGLIWAREGVAAQVLKNHGVEEDDIIALIHKDDVFADDTKEPGTDFTPRIMYILERSEQLALRYGFQVIGTEHILCSLLSDKECVANQILTELGVQTNQIFIDCLLAAGLDMSSAKAELQGKATQNVRQAGILDQYSTDLTQMAEEGKIDPVIGRKKETERLIQILSRRTKNNPCFVGEPGVGKTAVVEGFAQLLADRNVPEHMKGKRLISLDLSGVVAGSKYRGEFEERIKKIINEVKMSGDMILFIDEIHTIIGAGGAEGAIDASNILKPALARGEIQLIGATTRAEYTKYIEKDAALERRFQPIEVAEPSLEESIEILNGLKSRYEQHHHIEIPEESVVAAVQLSQRYVHDRYLPDKAIDLIDEAGSRKTMGLHMKPEELKDLETKLGRMADSFEQKLIDGDIIEARKQKREFDELNDHYQKKLDAWEKKGQRSFMTVTPDDIAEVVMMWTNIPVKQMQASEKKRLRNMEKILHQRVIGQEEAVKAVSKAVKRNRIGLKSPNRPIGSFLFLGPTGVGKTELSKALAEAVFGSEDEIIRVDMSEYMEKHSVSKLIGSPPGYVGFEDGGQLSEKVRRKPYSVILFDEIEKAHPDVFNILLQVLDDGHITDSQGRKVDFKNTIIIMTSNAGANRIISPKRLGFGVSDDREKDHEQMKQAVMQEVRQMFKPEFLNRIDEIMVFHSLTKAEVREIAKIMMKELISRVQNNLGITLSVSRYVYDYLAEKGYDEKYGARPLRRVIQTEIEDELADLILNETIAEGSDVTLRKKDNRLLFSQKER
ncbi:MAG: ATP-dependent Clp protease ATP-binding subunit [Lachnospiraceae bacterium]|nr:ATP-dependent Clp protease ATP-binding subunit [Lachnospiraceae bacterium]